MAVTDIIIDRLECTDVTAPKYVLKNISAYQRAMYPGRHT